MSDVSDTSAAGPSVETACALDYPVAFLSFPPANLDLCIWFNELMIAVLINEPDIASKLYATAKKWDTSQRYDWSVIREIQEILEFSNALKMGFNLLLGDVDISRKCKVEASLEKKVLSRLRQLQLDNPKAKITITEATKEHLTRTEEEGAIALGCYGKVLYSLMKFQKFMGTVPRKLYDKEIKEYYADIILYHRKQSEILNQVLSALRGFRVGAEFEFFRRIEGILHSEIRRKDKLFQFRNYLHILNDLSALAVNYKDM